MNQQTVNALALKVYLIYFFIFPNFVLACVNEYDRPVFTDINVDSILKAYENRKKDREYAHTELTERLARNWETNADLRKQNDLAVSLIRCGIPNKAIAILETIEEKLLSNPDLQLTNDDEFRYVIELQLTNRELIRNGGTVGDEAKLAEEIKSAWDAANRNRKMHPGEYRVAANLGTAYELSGNLEEAKKWIAIGMKRNPLAHQGTEWLHLRILEVKSALETEPDFLSRWRVLDRNPPGLTPLPDALTAVDIENAVGYQLAERLYFVDQPDAIVGDLLCSLGDQKYDRANYRDAGKLYTLCKQFEPVQGFSNFRRLRLLVGSWFAEFRAGSVTIILCFISIVLAAGVLGRLGRRRVISKGR